MKHLFYTHHLSWHRFLMLIGFLVLWQGIGWATVYDYSEDGINYSIVVSTNKRARVSSIDSKVTGTIRIPANITYEGENYPVTQISQRIRNKNVKDIYFTRVLPIFVNGIGNQEDATFDGEFATDAIIHVPDSLYDKAIKLFGDKYTITNGTRYTGAEEGFYYRENDITFFIQPKTLSASITSFPITESLHFPSEVTCNNTKYRITNINFDSKKNAISSTVKEIYFTSCYAILCAKEYAKGVIAHVPDSLFNKMIADEYTNYGKITDGKRWAYLSNIYPSYITGFHPEAYYDVTGDGKMEVFGKYSPTGYLTNSIFVTTLDGSVLRKEGIYYDSPLGTLTEPFYGIQMGLYDKEGLPLPASSDYSLRVYSYAKNSYIFNNNESYSSRYATFADINGNGQKEIIGSLGEGYIDMYRMTVDGSFMADKLYITSDTTAIHSSVLDEYTPNSGQIGVSSGSNNSTISSLGSGMFVKAKPAPDWTDWKEYNNISETSQAKQMVTANGVATYSMDATTGYCTARDLNGDGLIDLQDGSNIYYNLGNNKFFKSPHKGTVYSADLTGNGLLDFIDFGNKQVDLYINMNENGEMQMKTLLKNTAISNTFFGDFDKDGDVDILFVIPGSDYTIFQFYRNDGNGVFKAKDTDRDGTYTCLACNDYDGDGLYEILAQPKNSTSDYVLLKVNQKLTVSETALPSYVRAIGDVNNDGKMELVYNSDKNTNDTRYVIYDEVTNSKTNSRPEKMEKPSAVSFADAGKLKISWKRGKDAETSACDLTYELRIGSESGKGDIYFGRANADGTRRVIEDGNMGRSLKYMFDTNNLTEGKYYIAVQAVDACGLGGPWSDELIYDHKISAPTINKLADAYSTADTINITIQNPVSTATYEWNLSNGNVISQNENGSIIQAVFERAGEQTVTANMTLNGQTYKSDDAKITLAPSKYANLPASSNRTISSTRYLDLNQNGDVAVLSDKFFENKDGIYNEVRKTWNSDLTNGKFFIADFNHDGYPDFYLSDQDKGNVFTNSGEGDGSYEYDTETFDFDGYSSLNHSVYNLSSVFNIDFNNDGKLNLYHNVYSRILTSSGDERTFKTTDVNLFDFNRDGSLDRWYDYTDRSLGKAQTKVELRVAGEYDIYKDAKVFYENSNSYSMMGFADLNNDGYADGYFFDKAKDGDYYNLVIVKGKPVEEWPCKQTIVIPLSGISHVSSYNSNNYLVDFDNNGYLDFFIGNKLILFDKDFTYREISNAEDELGINTGESLYEYHWQPLTPGAYPNGYKSNIKNEAPSAPTNVTATSVSNGLLLKWDDATDDHTPWMQMRYNVSLKVKGKTGENAFVLSPLNGLSDDAAICSGVYYRKANQLVVPAKALTNGTTYELQVQAIDLMGEHSPMTKPVEVTYYAEKFIGSDSEVFFQNTNCIFGLTNASTTDL